MLSHHRHFHERKKWCYGGGRNNLIHQMIIAYRQANDTRQVRSFRLNSQILNRSFPGRFLLPGQLEARLGVVVAPAEK